VGPKYNEKFLYQREAGGDLTGREGYVNIEAEIRVIQPQAKECWQPPKAGTDSRTAWAT
jgi:hypothetical protein